MTNSGISRVLWGLLCAVILAGAAATAEEPSSAPAEPTPAYEEQILVTATRRAEDAADIPASVTVVTAPQIQATPAATMDAVLSVTVPGFALGRPGSESYSVNSLGGQDVNLRNLQGGGAARTLVLVDGVPLNDPIIGFIDWGRINLEDVERVEVVRTATSTAWGNQAMGGVIHIVTRRTGDRALRAHLEAGSGELKRGELSLAEAFGRHALSISGKIFDYGGFYAHAADLRGPVDVKRSAEQESANAEWRYAASPSAEYTFGAQWAADRRTTDTALDQNANQLQEMRAGGRWTGEASLWEARAYSMRQDQALRRGSANATRTVVTPNSDQYESPITAWGATAQWRRSLGLHSLLAGADVASGEAEVKENFRFSAGRFTRRRSFGGSSRVSGVFLEDEVRPGGRWSLRLGGRVSRWDSGDGRRDDRDLTTGAVVSERRFDNHSVTVFSPTVGAVVEIRPAAILRASLFSGFRAPLLYELYRPSRGVGTAANESNPELEPERLKGAEAGVRLAPRRGLHLDLAAYWLQVDDPIILRTVGFTGPTGGTIAPCGTLPANGVCRQRDNVGALRSRGIEASVDWEASSRWRLQWNHAFGESIITEAPGEPQLIGKWTRQAPKHTSALAVTWSHPRWLTVRAQGRYFGRRFQDDINRFPIESHTLVDVMLSRDMGTTWSVHVGALNAFDEEYFIQNDASDQEIGLPRRFNAGVRLRLGGA